MTLKSDLYSPDFPELRVIFMDEPFEVDGIIYTPPWKRANPMDTDLPVHCAPMFELKEEFYFEDYF